LFYKKKERSDGILLIIFLIVTILFSGFRDMIGGYDVYVYGEIYEKKSFSIPFLEKGYLIYNSILSRLFDNRYFLFFITALLIGLMQYVSIKKQSSIVIFSFFILFCKLYLMSFVYLRQCLAMGVLWLSIPYILKRNFLIFAAICLLAYSLHRSSIVFFPLYFLSNLKLSNFKISVVFIFAFLILYSTISSNLSFSLMLNDNNLDSYSFNKEGPNYFYIIESLILYVLLLKFKYDSTDTKLNLIRNGVLVYIIASIISSGNATLIRLNWNFFIFICLFIPYLYNSLENDIKRKITKNLIYIYFTLLFFRTLLIWDGGDLIPYKTIFQDFNRNGMWEYLEYR
jgi:hypothetical protein